MSKGIVTEHTQLVQSLGQLCQQHISDAFKKFNERCSSNLVGLAARAESNRLQTLYMDCQRLLRKQRAEVEAATLAAVMDHFAALEITEPAAQVEAPESQQSSSKAAEADNLKLLGHEDLEVMIALDNCSSRVREELRAALYELEGRLKSLVDNRGEIKILPMSPDAILEAFAAAIDRDMVAVEVQLQLIRIFDLSCFDQGYGEMLGVANQLLEEAGFSPVADTGETEHCEDNATQKSPELIDQAAGPDQDKVAVGIDQINEAVAEYAESTQPTQSTQPAGPVNSPVQTELLAKITSMLEQAERDSAPESAPLSPSHPSTPPQPSSAIEQSTATQATTNADGSQAAFQSQSVGAAKQAKPCMDKPQLLAEINKHMHDLIANRSELLGNGQITRELAATIKHLAAGENGTRLHRNDLSLFQVVENIFSSFGQSMVVAPEVQQVINRCELPMLKMAIEKPLILEQENHPIRRLFNEMAKYAIGLEQGDCEDNQIYQQMLTLSESMLGESFDEKKLPAMLSEFMAIVDRERQATSAVEVRELEQIAAREKVNWARTRVEEEITRRIVGKKLPDRVIDFIQRSWCMVMHMAHLRSGEAGSDWLVAIKILENLVHLARRTPSEADSQYRHELIAHIDARLGHIAADVAQRALQIVELREALGIAEAPTVQSAVVTEIAPAASRRRAEKIAKSAIENSITNSAKTTATDAGDTVAEQLVVDEIKRILVSAVKAELPGNNISQAVRDAESLDSSAQRILMTLQKGCWIELGGDIKAHKRGKLVGIVGPSWKYVFVDNKGKLIAERDRARLALELMDGKVTVLDNSHLFDKAIKQAITQIKGLPVAS